MMSVAFYELFLILTMFLGVVSPMPLGVPPLPEDPKLLGCAPGESVGYLQWFGTAEANPTSGTAR